MLTNLSNKKNNSNLMSKFENLRENRSTMGFFQKSLTKSRNN